MEKRVAIIGAGISGLLACKYAVSKGFHPIVFEEQDEVGGVWTQTIESTRLQNAKAAYEFSDFPWPSSVQDLFPHNTQLLEYVQTYAQKYQLLTYLKFGSKVISIDYVGESQEEMQSWELWGGTGKAFGSKGRWHLKVQHRKQDGSIQDYVAEFVIVCNGRFSGLPNIPEFSPGQGPEVFPGKVLHSMEYSALTNAEAAQLIKGKKIAVIGSGKSAIELALECAEANGIDYPCTLIQRTIHWMLPDLQPWGVNLGYLCANRFSELMVHKPGQGFLSSVLATLLSPLRWGISKFIESYVRWKHPLKKYNMVPKHSLLQSLSSCQISMLPENFYDRVEEGSIALKKSDRFKFCREGLILQGDKDLIKADIVIFATGFRGDEKLKNLFWSPTFQKCIAGSLNSVIPLYRQTIHPQIPQLAIIGYSESLSNLYAFEMRCQWLAFFLDQTFQLPSIKEMERDIKMWEDYMKQYAGKEYKRACIGGVQIWYNDQLCKDIGCNPRRKNGFFSELFEPYGLADYKGLSPKF